MHLHHAIMIRAFLETFTLPSAARWPWVVAPVLALASCATPPPPQARQGEARAHAFTAVATPIEGPAETASAAELAKTAVSLTPPPPEVAESVVLELVTEEAHEATALVAAPEPPGRLFVLQKPGLIRLLRGRTLVEAPFLDLRKQVAVNGRDNGEQGLLGIAFHPAFAKNGRFFINYTAKGGDTHVEERRVSKRDPNKADPHHARTLLVVDQPYGNHNAGDLTFGPDGLLYVGFGDGGAADDPHGHGQNANTRLGSLVRIDVDQAKPEPQTVAIGLRNPWRISFDRVTGDLYIGDVGQNAYEYVHLLSAAQLVAPGAPYNLGWNVMEGFHCFKGKPCDPSQYQSPIIEYPHSDGCSITGGYVYRGQALPALGGHYFYADYCTGLVRSLLWNGQALTASHDWKAVVDPESRLARLASFGEDQAGELYLVSHDGPIYKLVPRPAEPQGAL